MNSDKPVDKFYLQNQLINVIGKYVIQVELIKIVSKARVRQKVK